MTDHYVYIVYVIPEIPDGHDSGVHSVFADETDARVTCIVLNEDSDGDAYYWEKQEVKS